MSPSKESHADSPVRANKIVEVWKGLMLLSVVEDDQVLQSLLERGAQPHPQEQRLDLHFPMKLKIQLGIPIREEMSAVDFSPSLCFLYHSRGRKPKHFIGREYGYEQRKIVSAPYTCLWSVYLMNFDNQANDTSIWYYYSRDQKLYYGADSTIHNYFWHAFNDAFINAGMAVSSVDHPDLTAPSMWVSLRSITDERYNVRVTVQEKGTSTLSKDYSFEEALPAEADRSPQVMAQRAYRMTNRLIESVLVDPEFQKVITQP
jgi:hypothetical protein